MKWSTRLLPLLLLVSCQGDDEGGEPDGAVVKDARVDSLTRDQPKVNLAVRCVRKGS